MCKDTCDCLWLMGAGPGRCIGVPVCSWVFAGVGCIYVVVRVPGGVPVDQLLYLRHRVGDGGVLPHIYHLGHRVHHKGHRFPLLLAVADPTPRQPATHSRRVLVRTQEGDVGEVPVPTPLELVVRRVTSVLSQSLVP